MYTYTVQVLDYLYCRDRTLFSCANRVAYLFGLVVEKTDQLLDRFQVLEPRHVFGRDRALPDCTCEKEIEMRIIERIQLNAVGIQV